MATQEELAMKSFKCRSKHYEFLEFHKQVRDVEKAETCASLGAGTGETESSFVRNCMPNLKQLIATEPADKPFETLKTTLATDLPNVKCEAIQTKAQDWAGPNEPVDVVLAFGMLCQLNVEEERLAVLRRCFDKWLKPNGKLIITLGDANTFFNTVCQHGEHQHVDGAGHHHKGEGHHSHGEGHHGHCKGEDDKLHSESHHCKGEGHHVHDEGHKGHDKGHGHQGVSHEEHKHPTSESVAVELEALGYTIEKWYRYKNTIDLTNLDDDFLMLNPHGAPSKDGAKVDIAKKKEAIMKACPDGVGQIEASVMVVSKRH